MGGLIRPGAAVRGRLLGARAAAVRGRLLGARAAAVRGRLLGARAAAVRARRLGSWAVVALLAAAAGCGGERGASDTDQVRATLVQFGRATSRHDFTTVCERLLAPALVAKLSQIGLPCVQALEQGLGDVRAPRLSVGRITVRGDRARAVVRTSAEGQQPSEDTVELRRVNGSWRIASLAGTGT